MRPHTCVCACACASRAVRECPGRWVSHHEEARGGRVRRGAAPAQRALRQRRHTRRAPGVVGGRVGGRVGGPLLLRGLGQEVARRVAGAELHQLLLALLRLKGELLAQPALQEVGERRLRERHAKVLAVRLVEEPPHHRDEQRAVVAHALAQPVHRPGRRRGQLREGVVAAAHQKDFVLELRLEKVEHAAALVVLLDGPSRLLLVRDAQHRDVRRCAHCLEQREHRGARRHARRDSGGLGGCLLLLGLELLAPLLTLHLGALAHLGGILRLRDWGTVQSPKTFYAAFHQLNFVR